MRRRNSEEGKQRRFVPSGHPTSFPLARGRALTSTNLPGAAAGAVACCAKLADANDIARTIEKINLDSFRRGMFELLPEVGWLMDPEL